MAAETFHLDDVLQPNAPKRAAKALFGGQQEQLVQSHEQGGVATGLARLFQHQFRAALKGGGAHVRVHMAAEHGLLELGMLAIEKLEQLHAVHHGHADIKHHEIDVLGAEPAERGAGVGGGEHGPGSATVMFHLGLQEFEELRVVVHEKNGFLTG